MSSANTRNIKDANQKAATRLYPTRNDLPEETRAKVVAVMNERLAELIDLALVIKQAHWNLKGPQFIAVHEMLDGFRSGIDAHVDEVAERLVQLGGTALGTVQQVSKNTSLETYPADIHRVEDHLKALADHYAGAGKRVRKSIDQTDELGDADSSDLLTGVSRTLDSNLWFIEAHLQESA
ncbi:DNA starvation/stationary phase protection protein Dps [Kushneria marisflavi]|uniref:DNA starvation/stationary phase protection protein Dps n=1 Tax=Kushneria marisflavi TaxID=157779 RepID=A0A240US16_9GAMM|nr:DNA starvation/stationary phase protection protein Dps [Kushneria marisflavi]ART63832.1 DNA starvation/stationary phase protection protein Dps [Kushneria marisflavi]RKD85536.1 starvation-inducible DNA-binding protein [Kushneria marisflavi]